MVFSNEKMRLREQAEAITRGLQNFASYVYESLAYAQPLQKAHP